LGRERAPGCPAHTQEDSIMTASKNGSPRRALLLLVGLLAAGSALAASNTITYQGVLRDSAGDPVLTYPPII
jgi:hypothetical protein